jgi:glucose-1-phosphate thymidylyltransferase
MTLKGIVLAGGTATRLYPLTKVTNKHLLPVGRLPMIYWPIARLMEGGITEIAVVTSRDHMGEIVNLLGSGRDLGADFTYRVQDQAGGIAQALGLAENFVGSDGCVVILGDNVYTSPFADGIRDFAACPQGARIILKRVPDPGRYGVAELSSDGKSVVGIEEKPAQPKTDYAVTGVYMYEPGVFNVIKTLKPSGRGELEITDVNNHYIRQNMMKWSEFAGEWTDAGTFDSLLHASQLVHELAVPEIVKSVLERRA